MRTPRLSKCAWAVAIVACSALASVASAAGASRPIAILGATVFDATGTAPYEASVVIAGSRIAAVGSDVPIPKDAEIIDAKGQALLPGFYDLHTHWTVSGSPATTPQIAAADISHGVTTVDDFNAAPESYAARRRWLKTLPAPHVNLCARISTPGGHGADWADEATTRLAITPQSARYAVDSVMRYHPDCLGEVFTDGWRYGIQPDHTSMNEDTLAALDDEAHRYGLTVLTHTVRVERGYEAAEAHVDVIGHSLQDRDIDAETVALIKANHVAIAPTLAVYEPIKPGQPRPHEPYGAALQRRLLNWGIARHNLKVLYDAGVPIVLGTDSGMPDTPHGVSTLHEMELMVSAGMPASAVLIAGTANSARVMGELADRGTITVGKRADLVLIHGRPWADIHDVRNVSRVFVDGRLVFGPGAPPNPAGTAMPAASVAAVVDDFERRDGRSNLDTRVTTDPDTGLDRTAEIIQTVPRASGGHALLMTAQMSVKNQPHAEVVVPLTPGSVQPVDVRAYHGLQFDIRGDGAYTAIVSTLDGWWGATVAGAAEWQTVRLPFTVLRPLKSKYSTPGVWTGDDVIELRFEDSRPSHVQTWMEIDNLRFY